MSCCRLSAAIALALFVASSAAHAQTSASARADELLAKGQREFAEGKYADAVETLRSGYVIGNQARFLYALGQAYRMNHQCKEAVKAYRDFIKSDPSKTQIAAAEANITRCGEEDPSSLVEPPPPKPEPVVVAPVAAVVAPLPPPRKPTYKKWWPWTLMTVGLVGVGLGVGLGLGLKKSGSSFDTTLPEVGPNAMR